LSVNTSGNGKRVLLGAGRGGGPHVIQYNLVSGKKDSVSMFPFNSLWRGGVNVSFLDYDPINGVSFVAVPGTNYSNREDLGMDPVIIPKGNKKLTGLEEDIQAGIFNSEGSKIFNFPNVRPGSSIAAGDINEDGIEEIVIGSTVGEIPTVSIYKYDGTLLDAFHPYTPSLRSGLNVAVGDVIGSSKKEIIIAPRKGGGPHVLVYDNYGTKLNGSGFFAYDPKFHGGVTLAIGDVNGDGKNEIVTGPGPGGGPHIRYFRPDGTVVGQFFYNNNLLGFPNARDGLQIYIMPDYDGDNIDDILILAKNQKFAVSSAMTGEVIDPYKYMLDTYGYRGTRPNFDVLNNTLVYPYSLATHSIGGLDRIVQVTEGVNGPLVYQSGKDDFNIFSPFTADWKGGATISVLDIGNDGNPEYFVSPGTIFDSNEQLLAYDFSSESILGDNRPHSLIRKTFNTPFGNITANMVVVNLKYPGIQIRHPYSSCDSNNICVDSVRQMVERFNGGFAGINGVGPYIPPTGIGGGDEAYIGSIMFDQNGRWYPNGQIKHLSNS